MTDNEKKLRDIISSYETMAIAFSGGTDSTLLARVAKDVLGDKLLLVHITSPMAPYHESAFAQKWASENNFRLVVLDVDPLQDSMITRNCENRCYYCKTFIMKTVIATAAESGIETVVDGTNLDDFGDYRPGMKATEEQGIKHPLSDAGFSKAMIRLLAKEYGIDNWNTPPAACLATRIPCNTPLDRETLKMVGDSEEFLRQNGYAGCRVRVIKGMAKIEIDPSRFTDIIADLDSIVGKLKESGFSKVLLDLEGYKMGTCNPENAQNL